MRRRWATILVVLALIATACHGRGLPNPDPLATPILDRTVASQREARLWARDNGAPLWYRSLVPLFWSVAKARGVRPDGAFAQSAKETNFGRFGGVVDTSFRNPCGIKTRAGGANNDPNAHARFPNWLTGIQACVDHLALYAGAPGYPRANTADPRHFASIRGTATTFQRLGGRWAPNRLYGTSIVHAYLLHMIFDHR
jgi:N-acetylmuramoyl-L-alanine amidase